MTTPEITLCPDGHFRRAIYGIGPYIADYPEQVLLSCVVQGWCPRYLGSSLTVNFSTYLISRCTAKPENLDGHAGPRSQEHSEALLDEFNLKMLWEDYGIVGDVIVCF